MQVTMMMVFTFSAEKTSHFTNQNNVQTRTTKYLSCVLPTAEISASQEQQLLFAPQTVCSNCL